VLICNWASSVFLFLWGDLDLMIQWQIWKGNLGWNLFFFLRFFFLHWFSFLISPFKVEFVGNRALWFSLVFFIWGYSGRMI
jgi:hypothetical protein